MCRIHLDGSFRAIAKSDEGVDYFRHIVFLETVAEGGRALLLPLRLWAARCMVLHDDCSKDKHLCETSGFCDGLWLPAGGTRRQ